MSIIIGSILILKQFSRHCCSDIISLDSSSMSGVIYILWHLFLTWPLRIVTTYAFQQENGCSGFSYWLINAFLLLPYEAIFFHIIINAHDGVSRYARVFWGCLNFTWGGRRRWLRYSIGRYKCGLELRADSARPAVYASGWYRCPKF